MGSPSVMGTRGSFFLLQLSIITMSLSGPGDDHARFVFQRRRHALDEVEEALAAGSDVRAVLEVGGRPVALSRDIVSLVEQGIEGLKYECLIPLLFRLTHRFDPPSRIVASLCGEATVDQQTVAGHERR